ncbi:ElyC/SanA/YdcF family protein [Sphingomonas sp. CJ20]
MRAAIDALASPLPMLWAMLAIALWRASRRCRPGWAFRIATALVALGWMLGCTAVVDPLVRRWEGGFATSPGDPKPGGPRWIVVLAGGVQDAPDLPPAARLVSSSLYRVAEGVRLQRALPDATLLLLTGAPPGSARTATFGQAARAMGADPRRMRLLAGAMNTEAEARLVARALPSGAGLYLVSEALHLRRATFIFRSIGLAPVPVAAQVGANPAPRPLGIGAFVPHAANYRNVERLLHEQLGLWALGRIG